MATSERARILFIEDDAAIAAMYRLKLEAEGYLVDVADNGEAGLEQATAAAPPALVFLDLRLPRKDGLAVLSEMRKLAPTLPVVVLSNHSDPDMMDRTLALGANEYLVKSGVVPSELVKVVQRYVPA